MLLIKKEKVQDTNYHELQEQSWQTENWLGDEWLIVPDELREKVWDCAGHCDLAVKKDELVGITPKEIPVNPDEVKARKIAGLKQQLADTDYKAIKYAEGLYTETQYASIKETRQAWRDEIRVLEKEMAARAVSDDTSDALSLEDEIHSY